MTTDKGSDEMTKSAKQGLSPRQVFGTALASAAGSITAPSFRMLVIAGALIASGQIGLAQTQGPHTSSSGKSAGAIGRQADPLLDSAIRLASEPPKLKEMFNSARVSPEASPERANARPSPELLDMIASWLGTSFDLRASSERPRVDFVSAAKLISLRYRGLALDREPLIDSPKIEGLYDDRDRVIYLPESWRGDTLAEVSVLVHEMVHHLQNLAGAQFSCPDERERLAYKAQDRWLAVFGKSLAEEFDLDPFTVLAKTLCTR